MVKGKFKPKYPPHDCNEKTASELLKEQIDEIVWGTICAYQEIEDDPDFEGKDQRIVDEFWRLVEEKGFLVVKQTKIDELARKLYDALRDDASAPFEDSETAKIIIKVLSLSFPAPPESKPDPTPSEEELAMELFYVLNGYSKKLYEEHDGKFVWRDSGTHKNYLRFAKNHKDRFASYERIEKAIVEYFKDTHLNGKGVAKDIISILKEVKDEK